MASKSSRDKAGRITRFAPKKRKTNECRDFRGFNTVHKENKRKLVWVSTDESKPADKPAGTDTGLSSRVSTPPLLRLGFNDAEAATTQYQPSVSSTSKVSYREKRKRYSSEWAFIRPQLVNHIIIGASPFLFNCRLCKKYTEKICRCVDCGPHAYFCQKCCDDHHCISLLHIPEMWNPQLQCFEELDLGSIWARPDGHFCEFTTTTGITIIDERGRQHKQKIHMCRHQSSAAILAQYGLWPASPEKPYIAFSFPFMQTLKALVLEGQVSLYAFCSAMQQCRPGLDRPLKDQWVADIYKIINWECVLNFMWVHHSVSHLQFAGIDFPDGTQCVACPENGDADKRLIAMDGNMKLVHRAKAGHSVREPLHTTRFFLSQEAVDNFVDIHHATHNPVQQNCSNFQVESVVRTKNKTAKLDATGVFAAVCSHDYPCAIFNLRHGERMAYPIHMMNNIPNIGILMYDVGCQLETVLKKRNIPYDAVLSVPAFHILAHKLFCQLRYSPRRTCGTGLFDGEGTERLWSYLGKFSYFSKEMTPENRQDILVEALLNYGMKLSFNMGQSLGRRLCKAYMLRDSTDKQLSEEMLLLPGVTILDIERMAAEEKVRAANHKVPRAIESWKEQYALELHRYYQHRNGTENEVEDVPDDESTRLETSILRTERRHKMVRWTEEDPDFHLWLASACDNERLKKLEQVHEAVREYISLESMKKKYAEGSTIVKRIMPQVLDASKKLNLAIAAYNFLPEIGAPSPPHKIKRCEVTLPNAPIWHVLCPTISGPENVPLEKRRQLIDISYMNQRAKEEIEMTSKDFGRHLRWFKRLEMKLEQEIDHFKADPEKTPLEKGKLALLVKSWYRTCFWHKAVDGVSKRISADGVVDVEAFHKAVEEMNVDSTRPAEVTEMIESLEDISNLDGIQNDDDDIEE